MTMFESLWMYLWSPEFWLPAGYGWGELQNPNKFGIRFAEWTDLLYVIPCAITLTLFRFSIERHVFRPLGKRWAVAEKVCKPVASQPVLENYFLKEKAPKTKIDFKYLMSLTNLSRRKIERWFRRRNVIRSHTHKKLKKFSESMWRGCCYVMSCVIGLTVLWNKPWLWNLTECWADFPYHDMSYGIRFYYLFGASVYTSYTVSQFYDVKRKDFKEMFIHHITTLLLMSFSWLTNFGRVGTLILLLHDCGDIPLEFAKVAKYANRSKLCYALFGIFILLWIVTRLILFPFYIMHSINFEAKKHLQIFPMYTVMSHMVNTLFILHLFWSYFIFKIITKAYYERNSFDRVRDSRSSSDERKHGITTTHTSTNDDEGEPSQ